MQVSAASRRKFQEFREGYRWVREEKNGKPKPKNPKGGQRKPEEIRQLVLTIAKETGFGLTRIGDVIC